MNEHLIWYALIWGILMSPFYVVAFMAIIALWRLPKWLRKDE